MKRQTGAVIVMSLLLLVLVSCAAQFSFIAPAALYEATDLKELCALQKLTATGELKIADSLYSLGSVLMQKKKNEQAYGLLDRAIVYYRIALTKASILHKEKEIAQQEQALLKTREDVSAYKQALEELTTREQK